MAFSGADVEEYFYIVDLYYSASEIIQRACHAAQHRFASEATGEVVFANSALKRFWVLGA